MEVFLNYNLNSVFRIVRKISYKAFFRFMEYLLRKVPSEEKDSLFFRSQLKFQNRPTGRFALRYKTKKKYCKTLAQINKQNNKRKNGRLGGGCSRRKRQTLWPGLWGRHKVRRGWCGLLTDICRGPSEEFTPDTDVCDADTIPQLFASRRASRKKGFSHN